MVNCEFSPYFGECRRKKKVGQTPPPPTYKTNFNTDVSKTKVLKGDVVGSDSDKVVQENLVKPTEKTKIIYQVGEISIEVTGSREFENEGDTAKRFFIVNRNLKDHKGVESNQYSKTELLHLKAVIDKVINEEFVKTKEETETVDK